MRYNKKLAMMLWMIACFTCVSCKKSGSLVAAVPPTNLVVNTLISTDGSGKVSFTATADNAVSYVYDFGNGNSVTAASGSTAYVFTSGGIHTYTVNVTAKGSSVLTTTKTLTVTVNYVPTLVWSDEFNTDGAPDSTKWGYDLGAGGWGNNELEYYTNRSENTVVAGGVLKITAIKENYMGSPYTSARLLTKDKYAFKYGKVEVRAKLPEGVGTWPAIWMLGSDAATAGWPGCGEIDIMEHLGRDLNKIYGTLHYPGHSGGNADGGTRVIANATTEFHIYSLEWNAATIKISVDGEIVHIVANSSGIPFNHEFFLIMNMAMGGGFGGAVDPSFTNASMLVDYIRVYQ